MALIKCSECGREISDRAISCPGCGCPVESADTRTEIEKLVDEVWEKHPYSKTESIKELQRRGVNLKLAKQLMDNKFNSNEVKEAMQRKKIADAEEKRQNAENIRASCQAIQAAFGGSKVARCPKCHSTSISYGGNRPSIGRALFGGAVAGSTGAVLGGMTGKKGYAVCLNCGKRWKV